MWFLLLNVSDLALTLKEGQQRERQGERITTSGTGDVRLDRL